MRHGQLAAGVVARGLTLVVGTCSGRLLPLVNLSASMYNKVPLCAFATISYLAVQACTNTHRQLPRQ